MLVEKCISFYIGAFLCAFVGELILISVAPENRSIMSDFSNLGNLFVPVDQGDIENITKKMITYSSLKSIKLITKNFKLFEHNLDSLNNIDFKVIGPSPLNYPALSYTKFYNDRVEYLKEVKRFEYFVTLYSQNKLEWREANYDKLSVFIVDDKEVLLTVTNTGSNRSFYSKDPYEVQKFVYFFDGYFNSLKP